MKYQTLVMLDVEVNGCPVWIEPDTNGDIKVVTEILRRWKAATEEGFEVTTEPPRVLARKAWEECQCASERPEFGAWVNAEKGWVCSNCGNLYKSERLGRRRFDTPAPQVRNYDGGSGE